MDQDNTQQETHGFREKLGDVKEKVAEATTKSKEKVGELYSSMKDKLAQQDWEKMKESTKNYVRNNPEKAIGAALVVGFFLGYLIRRKGD